jgi:AcrR family transcriptional regulator
MDKIAARANITKRTLYLHFRSKDHLIAAALAHSIELAIESKGTVKLTPSPPSWIEQPAGKKHAMSELGQKPKGSP